MQCFQCEDWEERLSQDKHFKFLASSLQGASTPITLKERPCQALFLNHPYYYCVCMSRSTVKDWHIYSTESRFKVIHTLPIRLPLWYSGGT